MKPGVQQSIESLMVCYRQICANTNPSQSTAPFLRSVFYVLFSPATLPVKAENSDNFVATILSSLIAEIEKEMKDEANIDERKIEALHQICHALIATKLCDKAKIYPLLIQLAKEQYPTEGKINLDAPEIKLRKKIFDPFKPTHQHAGDFKPVLHDFKRRRNLAPSPSAPVISTQQRIVLPAAPLTSRGDEVKSRPAIPRLDISNLKKPQ
ncbi:MAG: hypothetical protein ACHQJ6_07000 [Candidatus Berkiellales bacterium]